MMHITSKELSFDQANASAIETNGIKLMFEAVRGHACQRIGRDMCLSDRNRT